MTTNLHATAVVLGDRGVLIAGASGAGKTQLALWLVSHAAANGLFARLVADDQLFLSAHGGRLVCTAPVAIAGLVEVRGIGPSATHHEPKVAVDLIVRLVGPADAERFPEPATETLLGCSVPQLTLSSHDRDAAGAAVLAHLSLPPFG
ncbi:HPr kinase/phosphorylase [Mesorhizobium marinum]|uniref:HPr kinase/phosphorylase n=1 Tax=Mesorhizobium marinum TaxID=3228790 RepID=UPI0034650129